MCNASEKRALITGATGFIGGHLTHRLKADGWEVHALVRPGSPADALRALLGDACIHTHDGTTEQMLALMQTARPTVVFHLASLFLAQHRTADITPLIRSNVEFGAQLAEAAAVHKVPHFINTGTAWQHYHDEDFNPVNLYAATKQAFADILRYYAESGAFRVTTLELFDTYGPGDTRPKLFTALRTAAAKGEPLAMSGGEQLIDLVYIDDVIAAFIAAAECSTVAPFETYAVGSGKPQRLRELVELWQRMTGRPLNIQWGVRPYRPREVMEPWTRRQTVPGWRPRAEVEVAIRRMEGINT